MGLLSPMTIEQLFILQEYKKNIDHAAKFF